MTPWVIALANSDRKKKRPELKEFLQSMPYWPLAARHDPGQKSENIGAAFRRFAAEHNKTPLTQIAEPTPAQAELRAFLSQFDG